MWDIDLRYASKAWAKNVRRTTVTELFEAYLIATDMLDVGLGGQPYQLLTIARGEFIVWGQGKCQAYLSVKEHEPVDGG